jgi:hypothetical protein
MRQVKTIFRHLRALWRFEIFDIGIETELSFHIETRTQDNIEAGMTALEAKADAVERFGDFEELKAECRRIKQQTRLERIKRMAHLLSWALAALGIVLKYTSSVLQVHQGAGVLIAIAILLRLLMYAKGRQQAPPRAIADRQERLLIDDES